MSRALVTGSSGFIGGRVAERLETAGHHALRYDIGHAPELLPGLVADAEFVFHLAGVNRPSDPAEFEMGNAKLTEKVCRLIENAGRDAVMVLASSTQAALDNPYGVSKRRAEEAVYNFAQRGGRAVIFRFPNVYGPHGRPNYNSVVSTFAHNIARGMPIEIHDPERELALLYVHDVADAMLDVIARPPARCSAERREVLPVVHATLQELADTLTAFRATRADASVPAVTTEFGKKLYATYLSYLTTDDFAYVLATRSDERGTLAEFLKSPTAGQLFISRTAPGKIRGDHYHHTKAEKFFVVEGDGIIRFRRVGVADEIIEYSIRGSDFRVVDIPPDYTHSIENVGSGELVVVFWASEIFNPTSPDTFALKV